MAEGDRSLVSRGALDERVEASLGAMLAPDPVAAKATKEALDLAAAIEPHVAGILGVVKAVAVFAGWAWQRRRPERAKDLLLGLYQRVQQTRYEYVSKEEFPDLLYEALRRVAEQPDEDRRGRLRRVFLKIIEAPKDYVQHRLFLRLADELPAAALKALDAATQSVDRDDLMEGNAAILARRARIGGDDIDGLMTYLAHADLMDTRQFNLRAANFQGGLRHLLTPLGLTFVDFMRG